jgi:thiopeptide-type bacteriocin biosynthesis protein
MFFVRYHDSDGHHIRLRIKSSTRDTMFSIFRPIHDILEECKKEGLYRNIKLNTYATESNRYGGDAAMPYIHTFSPLVLN